MKEKVGRRGFFKTMFFSAAVALTCTKSNEASTGDKEVNKNTDNTGAAKKTPRKKLGSTGAMVSVLQQGTSQILNPVYDKVLHLCYREGVNAIDTALSYGWGASHSAISVFIKQIKERKKLWITSKSGSRSPKSLAIDLDKCLKDLETDYLDLYLVHSISSPSVLNRGLVRAGERLKRSGKTRFFGLSTHSNCAEVMKAAAKTGGFDAILFRYSFRQFGEKDLNLAIDACKKAGIGLIAMKTMGSIPSNDEKVMKYKSKNFTLAQAKLKSVWDDERIDSIVSEMSSIEEARENIAAARSGVSLSSAEMHQLNRFAALTAGKSCSGCSDICESVISGKTRISDILRYLMYHESYGKREMAEELYRMLPLECRSFNIDDISKARKVCPQGIDIASFLKRAQNLFGT